MARSGVFFYFFCALDFLIQFFKRVGFTSSFKNFGCELTCAVFKCAWKNGGLK
jgi:hypothetical protein